MTKLSNLLIFLFISAVCFSQDTKFKEYSYTQFFDMIETEHDTIFKLGNAIIKFNSVTDSSYQFTSESDSLGNFEFKSVRKDSIHITKALNLNNVHFLSGAYIKGTGFFNMVFHKGVTLKNCGEITIGNTLFKESLVMSFDDDLEDLGTNILQNSLGYINIRNCTFLKGVHAYRDQKTLDNELISAQITFSKCNMYPLENKYHNHTNFNLSSILSLTVRECVFKGKGKVIINYGGIGKLFFLTENSFPECLVEISKHESSHDAFIYEISKNNFVNPLLVDFDISDKLIFDWDQVKSGMISDINYQRSLRELNPSKDFDYFGTFVDPKFAFKYHKEYRVENTEAFREESKLYGRFYNKYKNEQDLETANKVYIDLKDLQTERFKFIYHTNPSFNTFFTWKINQFLKTFSAYGTEPARAIVFSLYVILAFAFIYLFFPNSWDEHGKNRIVDRYTFFMKYMNKTAGIHEVYLEDHKAEIMQYDTFKDLISHSKEKVPGFFTITALPLYKWAISGTKLSAALLKRFDIMKGTWSDLPANKRFFKSMLLVGAFLIALTYDIFIKMLNALMLSINTFTTLGFGEIPIKGLPRYLAIIQGFIGWFMLTIFSVSLISQLLN